MGKRVNNLVGKKFGMLFVESLVPDVYPTRYNVICDCGNKKEIRGTALTYAGTKSCGCKSIEWRAAHNRKEPGIAGRNKVLNTYKKNARNRGHVFTITDEKAFELFESPCYYCGISKYNKTLPYDLHATYEYNGIDRVDNTLGYVEGNVVACCGRCNRAKDIMSPQEFDLWVEQLYTALLQRRGLISQL